MTPNKALLDLNELFMMVLDLLSANSDDQHDDAVDDFFSTHMISSN